MLALISGLFVSASLSAQTETSGTYGAYSPYSIYGIGGIAREGTAHTQTMGGVGIASRNNRFINTTNPAAVTARDTLSFMCDIGMYENNVIYAQGSGMDARNTFNVNNIVFSFPIWRSSAFMVGLAPFSDVGYSFSRKETDEEIQFMLNMLAGVDLDMPLVLDWEIPAEDARTKNMDARTLTDIQLHFCGQMKKMGFQPMVYFNWHQSENLYYLSELEDYPFWLALYQDRMTYPWKVEMWQWTSSGKVPGIQGNVDINVFMPH